jgi:hypothetical protein
LKLELAHSGLYGGSSRGSIGVCLVWLQPRNTASEHREMRSLVTAHRISSAWPHSVCANRPRAVNEGGRVPSSALQEQVQVVSRTLPEPDSVNNQAGTPPRHHACHEHTPARAKDKHDEPNGDAHRVQRKCAQYTRKSILDTGHKEQREDSSRHSRAPVHEGRSMPHTVADDSRRRAAPDASAALARMTFRNDLGLRTLLPLRHVVPPTKLLSPVELVLPVLLQGRRNGASTQSVSARHSCAHDHANRLL